MKRLFVMAVMLAALAATLGASTLSYSDSVVLSDPNWSQSLTIPKFDSSLGTLTAVTFQLSGMVMGDIKLENGDASPTTLYGHLTATITLTLPGTDGVLQVVPLYSTTHLVSGYDGTQDYVGDDSVSDIAHDTSSTISATEGNLTDVVRVSTIDDYDFDMPITAVDHSNASGAGLIFSQFAVQAGATVTVTYDYDPAPEPSLTLLSGSGLLALGLFGRRRLARRSRF